MARKKQEKKKQDKKPKKKIQITTSKTKQEIKDAALAKRAPKPVKPKPKPKPKQKLKKAKGFAPRPKVLLGDAAVVPSRKVVIDKLKENKRSKLHKMGSSEFRSWFKTKYDYDYPFRTPTEPKKKANKNTTIKKQK